MTTNTGMIFTSLVSFLVSVSAFGAGFSILKGKPKGDNLFSSYSYFLLLTSFLWFFVGLELFVSWLGQAVYARLFFFINQLFVFFSGPALAYYLGFKIFQKKLVAKILTGFYILVACVGLFFLFKLGIIEGESTYFADKLRPNIVSFFIFALMLVPLFVASFFDFFLLFINWLWKKGAVEPYDFLYSLIIAVYLFLGVFDERGLIVGWQLVFFRLIFASFFLMAYLIFYFQQSKKEKFLENLSNNDVS